MGAFPAIILALEGGTENYGQSHIYGWHDMCEFFHVAVCHSFSHSSHRATPVQRALPPTIFFLARLAYLVVRLFSFVV